jgi:sugar lactone lactonase YvrE
MAVSTNVNAQIVIPAAGDISAIAGTGTSGNVVNGQLATSAELANPRGVAVDASGNVYIADSADSVILEITASTGDISIVAGGGPVCTGHAPVGDGCAATSASLGVPLGVAVDTSGNLYIADTNDARIRKVTVSTGIITTVAGTGNGGYSGDGGLATSAKINAPASIAVDASGNIYIADQANNRIRKVTASTGYISTVAGSATVCSPATSACGDGNSATSANLNGPSGVAVDAQGNIYIADSGDSRVRKVTASSGDISSVAGTGNLGGCTTSNLEEPTGVAVDSAGDVYIADYQADCIRELTSAGLSTIVGSGSACTPSTSSCGNGGSAMSATLNNPFAVAVDRSGNIYIGDTADNWVRAVGGNGIRIPASGYINTIAGDGKLCSDDSTCGDGGLAIDAAVNGFQAVVDAMGNLYVAGTVGAKIRKVTVSTGVIETIAGTGDDACTPSTDACGDGGPAIDAEFSASSVALDSDGNLYIADYLANRIRKITATTGIITTVAGTGTQGYSGDGGSATSAELNYPFGVALDAAGNIYVADGNGRVRVVNTSTTTAVTIAGVTIQPGDIETVAGGGSGCTGQSDSIGDGCPATSALVGARYLTVDGAGNIYISDLTYNRVRKVTASTGIISLVAGNGSDCPAPTNSCGDGGAASSAEFLTPMGIGVDSAGNVYVMDQQDERVRVVNTSTTGPPVTVAGVIIQPGDIQTVAGLEGSSTVCSGATDSLGDGCPATRAKFGSSSNGMSLDAAGNIYIADSYYRIRIIAH